jgi:hypothetical protein
MALPRKRRRALVRLSATFPNGLENSVTLVPFNGARASTKRKREGLWSVPRAGARTLADIREVPGDDRLRAPASAGTVEDTTKVRKANTAKARGLVESLAPIVAAPPSRSCPFSIETLTARTRRSMCNSYPGHAERRQ